MPHVRLLPLLLLLPLLGAAGLSDAARSEDAEDPGGELPIRRVLLPAERIAAEMERAKLGALKQLPLAEFEDLVRRAERNTTALRTAPRLIESRYRARLEATDLVGTAEWKVHNPGPAARLLRLDPVNIALRRLPRFENRDAVIGNFGGRQPALLLDKPGMSSVALDWSAHGIADAEGLRFDLQLPPAAVATLDLYLPADRAVARAPDSHTVTGPLPAETADVRLWRVGFNSNFPLRLRVRRSNVQPPTAPILTARLETRQSLNPDGVEAEYTLKLETLRQEVRKLVCECDAGLRLTEVSISNLERRELRPAATPDAPGLLYLHLREPMRSGTLRVLGFAPRGASDSATWTSPALRLRDAVPRGERLTLRIHPNVRFDDWRPGRFRLEKTATEADGTQVLTLTGGGLGGAANSSDSARPQARLGTTGIDYQVRQLVWWQVQPRRSTLTCQLTYEAVRGRVFQLPVEVPAGWRVTRVETIPAGRLRDWEVRQERGGSVLLASLDRPLVPAPAPVSRRTIRLAVRLVAEGPAREWAFPDLTPRGARRRDGGLAIDWDEQVFRGQVETTALAAEPSMDGPWGNQKPAYYYSWSGEPVRGTLRLQPRAARVGVRCISEVVVAAGKAALVCHVQLLPAVGSPNQVEFVSSAPEANPWQWKTVQGNNRVLGFHPVLTGDTAALAALAAGTPWELATILRAAKSSRVPRRWRLTLARPLREPLSLDASCALARMPHGAWDVPLLAGVESHESQNEVALFVTGTELIQIESEGLHEVGGASQGGHGEAGAPWRTYRYTALPATLRLQGRALHSEPANLMSADQAVLTTYVEKSGRLLQHFRFRVWNWRQRALPLRLPAGAELLAARVDGLEIDRLPPAVSMGDHVLVNLPALVTAAQEIPAKEAQARAWHSYEILFAQQESPWSLCASLPTPPAILPIEPIVVRHTWRLPPDVVPLHQEQYRCLPSANRDRPAAEELLPFQLAGRWNAAKRWTMSGDWQAAQRLRMHEAATGLAGALDSTSATLSDLLERLAADPPGEPVVLDADALHHAGLDAGAILAKAKDRTAPPWEALGLVYIPCPAAPLLTTRREIETWHGAAWSLARGESETLAPPSRSIEDAVAEAAQHGHDASGRFRIAAEWLRDHGRGRDLQDAATGDSLYALLGALHAEYWTEWAPIAGCEGDGTLLLVRQDAIPCLGIVLAAVVGLIVWRLPRRGRWPALLIWLAIAGLSYLWLPAALRGAASWPLLAAVLALAAHLVCAALRGKRPADAIPVASVVIGGCLVVMAAGLGRTALGQGETPTPPTVFLVREPSGVKLSVLASPDLIERLQARAWRTDLTSTSAVLVDATYEGKVAGDDARFKAEFQVYCPADGPATLHLPLDGVQLDGDSLLDGARVYPAAAQAPLSGYTLKIDKGSSPLHRLTLHFRARIARIGEEREVQCSLPSVLSSRLTADCPKGSIGPEAWSGQAPVRGRQHVTALADGPRLEADLGRLTGPLRLRWRETDGTSPPARYHARELYLWDVRPDAANLTAFLRYTVTQGVVPSMTLDLPANLEVLAVRVSEPQGREKVRLKRWRVVEAGKARRLQIELQTPVSGEMTAVVQFAPRRPLVDAENLPLPVPRTTQGSEGLLACQFTGVEARLEPHGLSPSDREQFGREWQAAGLADPRLPWLPASAFSFQRGVTDPPKLNARFRIAVPRGHATQSVQWRVGPNQADFEATVQVSASDGNLALLEWEVPPDVTVARISSSDLLTWNQSGGRVQAWLVGPQSSARLHLAGFQKYARPSDAKPEVYQLPCLRLRSVAKVESWVRLAGNNGLTLEPMELTGLSPLPDARLTPPDLTYYAAASQYGGSFRLIQTPKLADARMLTVAEIRGRQVAFTVLVDYQVRQGASREATAEVRGWPAAELLCHAQEGMAHIRRADVGRTPPWTVALQANAEGHCRFSLTGTLPLEEAAAGVAMPDVRIPGVARAERWLATCSSDLQARTHTGVEEVSDPAASIAGWADPLRRAVNEAWRVANDDWRLVLRPRERPREAPTVQMFLAEQECAAADGRGWLYQSTYWLYHEANTDLLFVLPSGARLLGVNVADRALSPMQPADGRLWLPLPGGAGSCRVQLRWTSDGEPPLTQPRMQMPRLDGVTGGPVLWTVHVPAGYQLLSTPERVAAGRAALPASAAGLAVRRADCQQRLSALLAEKASAGDRDALAALVGAQHRFYRACRTAGQYLVALDSGGDAGPEGQALADWLDQMREQNRQLSQHHGFESLRADAEREARVASPAAGAGNGLVDKSKSDPLAGLGDSGPDDFLPRRGSPLYWQADAGSAGPSVVLTTLRAADARRALAASATWLALLVLLALAARSAAFRSWLRLFWPEQIALLGCLAWQAAGPNPVSFFLVGLGIVGRVVLLLLWFFRWIRRHGAATPAAA